MKAKRYLFYISQNYSFAILRPLQKVIWAQGGKVYWFVEGNAVNLDFFHEDELRLLSVDDVINYAPQATFFPANIVPTFLPGINVAIFHGFDAGKVDKKGRNDHYKMRHCFDLYCTQGPESTGKFNDFYQEHSSFYIKETGWCALDSLYKENTTIQAKPLVNEKPVILLCSTFSKRLSCAPHLLAQVKRLSEEGKWQWLVQFHPKMDKAISNQYKAIQNDSLTFVETDDVMPLLQQADVMVCDTSSVLLMFLLLNKPVVTFNNIAPKDYLLNILEAEKLEESIEFALSRPATLMKNIATFIAQTHPYQDGKSSERVLMAVDEVLNAPKPPKTKPLNLLRQFKMRKKLGYWKF